MRNIIFITIAMFLASCGGNSGSLDQTKPESIMNAIFEAANSGNYDALGNLCDPKGENDKDTKMICKLGKGKADDELKSDFKKYFAKGKVTGTPKIEGDKCKLDFTFGRDGTKKETMNFIKRDGKWYLYSF